MVQAEWAAPRSKVQRMERTVCEQEGQAGPLPAAPACKAACAPTYARRGPDGRGRPLALPRSWAFILRVPLRMREKVHQVMTLPFLRCGSPHPGKGWVLCRLLGEGLHKGLHGGDRVRVAFKRPPWEPLGGRQKSMGFRLSAL